MTKNGQGDQPPEATKQSWFKTATGKVVSAVGTIIVAVITAVVVTTVNNEVHKSPAPPPPSAAMRNTNATVAVNPVSESPAAVAGWSLHGTPSEMSGDFLTLTATMLPGRSCQTQGSGWVFEEPAAMLEPLPWDADTEGESEWAFRNGGVPASGNFITVNIQSRAGQPVIIDSIGVRVIKRAPIPTSGTHATPTAQCGPLEPAFFEVDLDDGGQARPVNGWNGVSEVAPVPLPHRLDDTNPSEQWRIALLTSDCDCTVIPYFRYTSNGQSAEVDITNRGEPWRVTATGTAQTAQHGNAGEWCIPLPESYGC